MQFHKKNITSEWIDLVQDYPEFFLIPSPKVIDHFNEARNRGWINVPQSFVDVVNLRYGFECDIGWKEIIREFCESIKNLINEANLQGHEIFYTSFIIKEKFGECHQQGHFYGKDIDVYWERYCEISQDLMIKSSNICEKTGKFGKLVHRNYWCKTLCEEEAEKWLNYK